jgi:hypothetical protein
LREEIFSVAIEGVRKTHSTVASEVIAQVTHISDRVGGVLSATISGVGDCGGLGPAMERLDQMPWA